jgi:serpin B
MAAAMKACLGVLAVVLVCGICPAEEAATHERPADVTALAQANDAFALDLYGRLSAAEGNLFFSPYSISTALGMTYAGARGETAKQMAAALRFPDWPMDRLQTAFGELVKNTRPGEKGGYQLDVANALWVQKGYGLKKEFLDLVKSDYGSGVNEVDFQSGAEQARSAINKWVEERTHGKIEDLFARGVIDALTRLVLADAIYFKGNWAHKFDGKKTTRQPFTLADGKEKQVQMMRQTEHFRYMETPGFEALEMPYAGDELSMAIFLPATPPAQEGQERAGQVEKSLSAENLSKWLDMNQFQSKRVDVSLPRFKLTEQFRLDRTLEGMGMKDAFGSSADFSGMSGKPELCIGAVVHKAYVEVNEEGTEAAAATGAVMRLTATLRQEPKIFRADHPFLFLIRDRRSGSILFVGRLMDPGSALQ